MLLLLSAGQALGSDSGMEETRRALEEMNRLEQEAFVEGDCDGLLAMLHEDVSFDVNGRKMPRAAVGEFCTRIPRPFPGAAEVETSIEPVGAGAGYVVKVMSFPGTPKVEVVTKIWKRGNDGWKIVHFQSTVMPPRGPSGPRPEAV